MNNDTRIRLIDVLFACLSFAALVLNLLPLLGAR
jgi:hypothetical protein